MLILLDNNHLRCGSKKAVFLKSPVAGNFSFESWSSFSGHLVSVGDHASCFAEHGILWKEDRHSLKISSKVSVSVWNVLAVCWEANGHAHILCVHVCVCVGSSRRGGGSLPEHMLWVTSFSCFGW